MSWLGIVPPTVTTTSPASCSRRSSITRGTRVMCAPERIERPDGVGVLLQHGLDDLLGRLVEAGVDDLHARVAERARDDLRASVMTVEAGLGHDDANLACHGQTLPPNRLYSATMFDRTAPTSSSGISVRP